MNVSTLSANVPNASDSKTNGASAPSSTSSVGIGNTAGATPAVQSSQGIGPAATVSISGSARSAMRAAGVPQAEMAKVNVNDKNAVNRAIRLAKASHGQKSVSATAATSSAGKNQSAGAGTAAKASQ